MLRDFLHNLLSGGRLALLRPVTASSFAASLEQVLLLLLASLGLTLGLDYLATEGPRFFEPWGAVTLAAHICFLMVASFAVARLAGLKTDGLPFLTAVLSVFVYANLYWAFYRAVNDGRVLTWSLELTWALYVLFFVWIGLVVRRVLQGVLGTGFWRACLLGGLFAALYGAPLYVLPGAYFWYPAPEEAAAAPPIRLNIEETYTAQPRLLAERTAPLLAQRAGTTDLYFLGFAPYGDQDVFLREVRDFRALFDERFDTAGRSLNLINNPATVGQVPLASVSNLRAALRSLGERMDVEEDLLFLYVTSHGSRNHRVAVTLGRLGLNHLSPQALRAALDESGIRWRVIVIQACFSGGFIEALRDERTLVITAAQHDRQSFGCDDSREYSYFGEAFFERQLRVERSFYSAYTGATELIAEWEAAEGYEPSNPQIVAGTAILPKLEELEARLRRRPLTAERP